VKNEILLNMESLEHYVSQLTNTLQGAKLKKYKELLKKALDRSLPIDVTVGHWYNNWVEGRSVSSNFMGFMHHKYHEFRVKSSIEFLSLLRNSSLQQGMPLRQRGGVNITGKLRRCSIGY